MAGKVHVKGHAILIGILNSLQNDDYEKYSNDIQNIKDALAKPINLNDSVAVRTAEEEANGLINGILSRLHYDGVADQIQSPKDDEKIQVIEKIKSFFRNKSKIEGHDPVAEEQGLVESITRHLHLINTLKTLQRYNESLLPKPTTHFKTYIEKIKTFLKKIENSAEDISDAEKESKGLIDGIKEQVNLLHTLDFLKKHNQKLYKDAPILGSASSIIVEINNLLSKERKDPEAVKAAEKEAGAFNAGIKDRLIIIKTLDILKTHQYPINPNNIVLRSNRTVIRQIEIDSDKMTAKDFIANNQEFLTLINILDTLKTPAYALHGGRGKEFGGKTYATSAGSIIKKIDHLLTKKIDFTDEVTVKGLKKEAKELITSIKTELGQKQEATSGLFGLGARDKSTAETYKLALQKIVEGKPKEDPAAGPAMS